MLGLLNICSRNYVVALVESPGSNTRRSGRVLVYLRVRQSVGLFVEGCGLKANAVDCFRALALNSKSSAEYQLVVTYMHVYTYMYRIYIYILAHTCLCLCVYVYEHIISPSSLPIYLYFLYCVFFVLSCLFARMCVHMYRHICIDTCAHTYSHDRTRISRPSETPWNLEPSQCLNILQALKA